MKKLLLAGLLATLGISAVLGWRAWHDVRAEVSGGTASGAAAANAATHGAASAAGDASRRQSKSSATATTASGPKRAWDYHYFASLSNAAPGVPIQFELTAGKLAAGTIRHTERTNGELTYLSGELTQPESGRFFFQKQALPGKQGDYSIQGDFIYVYVGDGTNHQWKRFAISDY